MSVSTRVVLLGQNRTITINSCRQPFPFILLFGGNIFHMLRHEVRSAFLYSAHISTPYAVYAPSFSFSVFYNKAYCQSCSVIDQTHTHNRKSVTFAAFASSLSSCKSTINRPRNFSNFNLMPCLYHTSLLLGHLLLFHSGLRSAANLSLLSYYFTLLFSSSILFLKCRPPSSAPAETFVASAILLHGLGHLHPCAYYWASILTSMSHRPMPGSKTPATAPRWHKAGLRARHRSDTMSLGDVRALMQATKTDSQSQQTRRIQIFSRLGLLKRIGELGALGATCSASSLLWPL